MKGVASTFIAGVTYGNRVIKGIIFKAGSPTRGAFIDCGIHAREWVAVTSCIWFIEQIARGWIDGDDSTTALLNKYEIHVYPLVNPDGYEYSRTTNRNWRKNRNPNSGSSCIGTDLNRNYDFHWAVIGASTDPCSDAYHGASADSELETKAIQRVIQNKIGFWDVYIAIHTFGNYWVSPWSYSTTITPSDFPELLAQSKIGADAMKTVFNSEITTGHSGGLYGAISGVSDDWAKGVAGIKFSYTLQLAPGNNEPDTSFGFALPEDRLPRVGQELTAGLYAFLIDRSTTTTG